MFSSSPSRSRVPALLAVFSSIAGLALSGPAAGQAGCPDPVPESEWSITMPLATKSMMIDIMRIDGAVFAVGDRGQVLVSRDQGRTWSQQSTPTRSMLTAVWFADESHGWVVGHDAVILRTENGGETWCRVHWAPELEQPLFDVWFSDAENGFAIGAYGYFLRTSDGGLTWDEEPMELVDEQAEDAVDAEGGEDDEGASDEWDEDFNVGADLHLNKIIPAGDGRIYVAAEAGAIFRSDDGGNTWAQLDSPYDGSFFSGVHLGGDSVILFGLRGNLFRSDDGGANWRPIALPVETSLFGGTRLDDGSIIVVGSSGVALVSREGDSFRLVQRPDRKVLVTVQPAGDEGLVFVGEPGVERAERSDLAAR